MKKDINLYASEHDINQIKQRFGYVFEKLLPEANGFYYKPCLNPKVIKGSFKIKDLTISSILQNHGFTESLGFRINNFAYCTDVLDFEESQFKKLKKFGSVDCRLSKDFFLIKLTHILIRL